MKRFLKKIVFKIFPSIKFKRSGERQVSSDLSEIRADHRGRYKFAEKFVEPNTKVLDVACGIGYGSYMIADANPDVSVLGVDLEKRAVEYADKNYKVKNNEFIVGNALELGMKENSFDTVVSFETIEHLPEPDKFLDNISSLLKPGGLFFVSSPNQEVLPFRKEKFPFHLRHFTVNELTELLEMNGFEIANVYSQHEKESEKVEQNDKGLYLIFHAIRKN